MKELKLFVERCVRPVVLEESAKLRMRRELYAHAEQAYQQELAAAENDHERALKQTLKRLGEQEALSAELQASVGTLDRWSGHIDAIMYRPQGMSVWRYALRATLYFGGLFVAVLVLIFLWRLPDILARETWATEELRFVGSLGFVWIVNEYLCIAIFGKMCEIFLQANWTFGRVAQSIMLATAAAVEVLLAGWLFTLLTTGSHDFAHLLPFWPLLALFVALSMIAVPWLSEVQLRGLKEWRELKIEG